MTLAAGLDQQRFVNDAADEIDSTIGGMYVLPINKSLLTVRSTLILKRINNWLATGQIVCTLAIGGEDKAMNAYGMSMLKDARSLLLQVASGAILLEDAVLVEGEEGSRGPRTVNHDAVSALDVYEDRTMRWHPVPPPPSWGKPIWQPGGA